MNADKNELGKGSIVAFVRKLVRDESKAGKQVFFESLSKSNKRSLARLLLQEWVKALHEINKADARTLAKMADKTLLLVNAKTGIAEAAVLIWSCGAGCSIEVDTFYLQCHVFVDDVAQQAAIPPQAADLLLAAAGVKRG